MVLPVILEPMPDSRVRAHSANPIPVSVIGNDADEALRLWRQSFRETLPAGAKVVMVNPSEAATHPLAEVAGLLKAQPQTRVLILSMHQNEEYVRQALRHGAAGYLLKDAAPAEHGIGRVLANDYFVDTAIERVVVGPTVATARKVLWRGLDLGLINGVLVQGSAQLMRILSTIASRAQVGFAGSYAWAIALGAIALIGVFTLRGGQ